MRRGRKAVIALTILVVCGLIFWLHPWVQVHTTLTAGAVHKHLERNQVPQSAEIDLKPVISTDSQSAKKTLKFGIPADSDGQSKPLKPGTVAASFGQSTNETWKVLRHQFEEFWPDITERLPLSGYDQSLKNPCWWQNESSNSKLSQSKYFTRYIMSFPSGKAIDKAVSQPSGPYLYCLPYFFMIGMAKCGTTDLYRRMMEHPQIVSVPHQLKEAHWWNFVRSRGYTFLDYLYFFSLASKEIRDASQHGVQMVTGDATGTTMSDFDPNSKMLTLPQQIYSVFPQVKLIAIIRDPVERFYSDYVYFTCTRQLDMMRTKIEFNQQCSPENFHKHVTSVVSQFRMCTTRSSLQFCVHQNQFPLNRLLRGLYYPLLVPWTTLFPLGKQLLVIRMEEYSSKPADILHRVFSFLNLDPPTDEVISRMMVKGPQNQGDSLMKEKTGAMLAETRKVLQEFYAPYNKQLARLLGDEGYLWESTLKT